tara:strand:+ start:265 stop:618 length:354 start_codon:yes stop_codon:yes gene_type:complete
MDTIFFICLVASVLFVWFQTEAFAEYAKLLGLGGVFAIEKYEKYLLIDRISYPAFLTVTRPNFFTKLIGCPACLGFWLSLASGLQMRDVLSVPIVYVGGLLFYSVMTLLYPTDNGEG